MSWFTAKRSGGVALKAGANSFLGTASQGALIASLNNPFAGATTYATVGAVPGQLALSNGTIVKGASDGTAGQDYSIKIRATSADGKREVAETLTFRAAYTLATLTISGSSFHVGDAAGSVIGSIVGKTSGSTVTVDDDRLSVSSDGSQLLVALDPASASGTISATLTETLAGAIGSPKASPITVTAQALSVPAAPAIVVTSGNAQNSIAWTDGASGGSAITSHKLYASTTAGFTPGPSNLITQPGSSPYIHAALTNGTPVYYRMSALNAVGESAYSAEATGTPETQNNDLLLIIAGQSNAGAQGTTGATPPASHIALASNPNIRIWNSDLSGVGATWQSYQVATNSNPVQGSSPQYWGAEAQFLVLYAAKYPDARIDIIKDSPGGSQLYDDTAANSWNSRATVATVKLYNSFKAMILAAKAAALNVRTGYRTMVCWRQGETESIASNGSSFKADAYNTNLTNLFTDLNADVGPIDLYMVHQLFGTTTGNPSNLISAYPYCDPVRAAQASVVSALGSKGILVDDAPAWTTANGSNIHYPPSSIDGPAGTGARMYAPFALPDVSTAGSIGGTAQVDQTLTYTPVVWNYTPTSVAYQWKRNGVAIGGATNATYVAVAADIGAVLTVTETATARLGTTPPTTCTGTSAVLGPTLGSLVLVGASTLPSDTTASGNITGAYSGSTIALISPPTGFTINSGARTWAYDGTGSGGTANFSTRETLSIATNSPHDTSQSITFTSVDAATTALINAAVAAGGSAPNGTRKAAIDALIVGLKNDGLWAKLIALEIVAGHDDIFSEMEWKSAARKVAVFAGLPSFVTDRGWTLNGTDQSLTTGLNPTTLSLAQNQVGFGIWIAAGTGTNAACGMSGSTGNRFGINKGGSGAISGGCSAVSSTIQAAVGAPARAVDHYIQRNGSSTTIDYYVNGSVQAASVAQNSASVQNSNLLLGQNGTTPTYASDRYFAVYFTDGTLSSADVANLHSRLSTYKTAIGA